MFLSVVNAVRRCGHIAFAMLLALQILLGPPALAATELLMLEQPGCPWCKKFNEEIAPAYANTEEGRRAPLRRVDITEEWPEDLADIRPERLTPTFVLLHDGVEIDRLRGYPGDEFFWGLLNTMLGKLPAEEKALPDG